jgi:hypothetical protein
LGDSGLRSFSVYGHFLAICAFKSIIDSLFEDRGDLSLFYFKLLEVYERLILCFEVVKFL